MKGSCSAGADTVHALLDVAAFKIYNLGIFSAQFNRDVGLRSIVLQGRRYGDDFLHKRNFQMFGQRQAGRFL